MAIMIIMWDKEVYKTPKTGPWTQKVFNKYNCMMTVEVMMMKRMMTYDDHVIKTIHSPGYYAASDPGTFIHPVCFLL